MSRNTGKRSYSVPFDAVVPCPLYTEIVPMLFDLGTTQLNVISQRFDVNAALKRLKIVPWSDQHVIIGGISDYLKIRHATKDQLPGTKVKIQQFRPELIGREQCIILADIIMSDVYYYHPHADIIVAGVFRHMQFNQQIKSFFESEHGLNVSSVRRFLDSSNLMGHSRYHQLVNQHYPHTRRDDDTVDETPESAHPKDNRDKGDQEIPQKSSGDQPQSIPHHPLKDRVSTAPTERWGLFPLQLIDKTRPSDDTLAFGLDNEGRLTKVELRSSTTISDISAQVLECRRNANSGSVSVQFDGSEPFPRRRFAIETRRHLSFCNNANRLIISHEQTSKGFTGTYIPFDHASLQVTVSPGETGGWEIHDDFAGETIGALSHQGEARFRFFWERSNIAVESVMHDILVTAEPLS